MAYVRVREFQKSSPKKLIPDDHAKQHHDGSISLPPGTSFDLPVLRYRATICAGIILPSIFQAVWHRLGRSCDKLSSFSSGGKVKLDELSKILGFAGKPTDIDRSEVERYFRDGRISEIAAYCETDVVNTFRVWLRHELFCGRLTSATYEQSEQSLTRFLQAHALIKPDLARLTNTAVSENGSVDKIVGSVAIDSLAICQTGVDSAPA